MALMSGEIASRLKWEMDTTQHTSSTATNDVAGVPWPTKEDAGIEVRGGVHIKKGP